MNVISMYGSYNRRLCRTFLRCDCLRQFQNLSNQWWAHLVDFSRWEKKKASSRPRTASKSSQTTTRHPDRRSNWAPMGFQRWRFRKDSTPHHCTYLRPLPIHRSVRKFKDRLGINTKIKRSLYSCADWYTMLLYSPLAYGTIQSVKLTRTMCAWAGQNSRY